MTNNIVANRCITTRETKPTGSIPDVVPSTSDLDQRIITCSQSTIAQRTVLTGSSQDFIDRAKKTLLNSRTVLQKSEDQHKPWGITQTIARAAWQGIAISTIFIFVFENLKRINMHSLFRLLKP